MENVPHSVQKLFDDALVLSGEMKRVYVSLGLFSIVKLMRDVQLLIPAYDFCVPDKECVFAEDDDPCAAFRRMAFPVDQFCPSSQTPHGVQGGCEGHDRPRCPSDGCRH